MGSKPEKFEIKKSPIDGRGCIAVKPIKAGELICIMDGEEIFIPELKKRYETGRERLSDPLQVSEKNYLDLYEPYVFINHSCDPNAAVTRRNTLVALRDVAIGEEIAYDYSATEWSNHENWQGYDDWVMDCNCGKAVCRRRIREFCFLPVSLQGKYVSRGWCTDFIVEKYKKRHGGLI